MDVNDTYRRLYERVPIEKLRLVSRAIERIERSTDGSLAVAYISAEDYADTGASEVLTEGIIDHVRALEGTEVAAMIRDKTDGAGPRARSACARRWAGWTSRGSPARRAGGGTRGRPGFSTDLEYPELVEFLCAEVRAQL